MTQDKSLEHAIEHASAFGSKRSVRGERRPDICLIHYYLYTLQNMPQLERINIIATKAGIARTASLTAFWRRIG